MSIKKHKTASKIASVLVSITTVGWLSGVAALAPMAAYAQTDTAALIASLQAQIAALQAQLNTLAAPATGAKCSFTRSLTVGARGDDVTCLQNYLSGTGHFTFAGGATGYFGNVTKTSVAAWQAASGVFPAAGYFGPISQAKYNSMVVAGPAPAPAPAPAPTPAGTPAAVPAAAGTLRVETGTHPASSLFPTNSTRVPFTVVKFTAPAGQDITVSSLTVERTGLASDSAFSGVVLLDEAGTQLGVAKTLNSAHQAVITDKFEVKGGTTRTITLAGNAQTSNGGFGGQIAYLSLVNVVHNASSLVGSLPVTGTGHTVNETLTIGSVTMVRGSTDPGSNQTKEVGTTAYTFSSVKVTAGSAEKVYLRSIRWNQTGSIGTSDLVNAKTYVEGVAYDVTVSSDAKYYTSVFGDNNGRGILMDKGFSKELSIKGDVNGGSGRTVDFDLAKRTDIGLIGESYGYGITPPQTGSSDPTDDTAAFSSVEDPWYDAAQVTVSAGSIQVSTSNAAPAQNVAVNLANQPFGAFTVDVKGESISVGRIALNVTLGSEGGNDDVDDLTSVVLVDDTGLIVAGPVDGSATDSGNTAGSGDGMIVFTDTVTFNPGIKSYILKGKVGTDVDNNVTIIASTTPSSDFATVRGLITGNTITPSPTSVLSFNTMTVKTGSLTISVSSVPIAQTVIANTKNFEFARYVLDATASGEDVRLTTVPLTYGFEANGTAGAATDVSNCRLYDGSALLTSGSNIVNPTAAGSGTTFTFDGTGLIVSKGTSKTIGLKCDLVGGATAGYYWGLDTAQASSYTGATGLTSGQTIVEAMTEANGQKMTAASGGTFAGALDTGSPGYKVVSAGSTGVELVKIRFSASNEDINLKQIALQLTGAGSSTGDSIGSTTASALVSRKVTLWDGITQVGEATFSLFQHLAATAGPNFFATSSQISNFTIPKDGAKILTVKGDIAAITSSGPLTQSGELLIVDYDGGNTGLNGTYGVGASSGSTLSPTGADTAASGVRIMKAYPELSYIALSTAERSLPAGTTASKTMYKFSVKAVGGDVALYKMTFQVSSSTQTGASGTTSLFSLYAYTDSAVSIADTTFSSDGLLNDGQSFCADAISTGQWTLTGVNSTNATGLCGTAAGAISGTAFPLAIYMDKEAGATHSATTTYIVPSGATRYFVLKATTGGVRSSGQESLQVAMEGDAAFPTVGQVGGTRGGTAVSEEVRYFNMFNATTTDRSDNDDFIWSPISTTSTSAIDDLDFTNGYLLPGLPTGNMTLETLTTSN